MAFKYLCLLLPLQGVGGLNLYLNLYPAGQFKFHQRVNCFGVGAVNVQQPFVRA